MLWKDYCSDFYVILSESLVTAGGLCFELYNSFSKSLVFNFALLL